MCFTCACKSSSDLLVLINYFSPWGLRSNNCTNCTGKRTVATATTDSLRARRVAPSATVAGVAMQGGGGCNPRLCNRFAIVQQLRHKYSWTSHLLSHCCPHPRLVAKATGRWRIARGIISGASYSPTLLLGMCGSCGLSMLGGMAWGCSCFGLYTYDRIFLQKSDWG